MEEAGHQEKLDHLLASLDRDWERLNTAQDDWIERLGNTRGLLRSLAGALEKHKAESAEFQVQTRESLNAMREALAGGDGAAAEAEAALATCTEELESAKATIALHSSRIAELEAAMAERDAALLAAASESEEVLSMRQELAELREAERALKGELANLRPQAEQAASESEQAKEALAAQRAELDALRSQLQEAITSRDVAAGHLAEREAQGATAMDQLRQAEERAAAAEARAGDIERELADLLERAGAAEREAASLRAGHEQALAAQEELGTQLAQLQKQLDAERARVRSFEEQVEDEKSKGTKATLAAQLAEALQEAEEARTEVRTLKRALEEASRNVEQVVTRSEPTAPMRRSSEEEVNLVRQAAEAKGGGKFTIGELLINAGLVTQAQVEQAIEEQKQDRHQHIGAILVRNGWASEDAVAQALAYQCNVDFVRFADLNLNAESTALISERIANQHGCVPIDADDGSITLAMVNPLNLVAIEDIERITSRKVEVVVGAPREIQEAISKFYWEPE